MRRAWSWAAAAGALALGCGDGAAPAGAPAPATAAAATTATAVAPAAPAAPAPLAAFLPDTLGAFTAGPLVSGDGFVRRSYSRAAASIDVTIGTYPMTAAQWSDWIAASAPYAPVAVDVPAGGAAGFWDCTAGAREPCDLHIQLRAGYHVEIGGNAAATRADLGAVLGALPLAALAAR